MILKMLETVPALSDDNHETTPTMNTTTTSSPRGQFEGLKNLKREMEYRNSELGKTWSELSRIMYQYQSELIQKHDELDSSLAPGERARITHLESVIDNSKNNVSKLEKRIADLEYKLLEKDSEIVRLRTEVHQLKNEVTMKDNLIQKIQNQMATEAMEYQNEIVSLKELLQVESINNIVAESHTLGAKRRKTVKTSRASPQTFVSTDNSAFVKSEHGLESLPPRNPPVFPSPQPVRRNGQPMDNDTVDALASTSMSDSQQQQDSFYENSSQEDDNSGDVMADHEGDPAASQSENRLLMDDVYGATGQQSQGLCFVTPSELIAERLEAADSEHALQQRLAKMVYTNYESSENGSYRCHVCSRVFGYKHVVIKHLRSHFDVRPYSCLICKTTFKRRDTAVSHLRKRHMLNGQPVGDYIGLDTTLMVEKD